MFKKIEYKLFQVILVLILFLHFSNLAAASAPAEQWNRSFGGDGEDISRCIQQTSDGGYIVAGTTIPYGKELEGYHDAWLIKVDRKGNMQWNKTFERMYAGLGYFTRQSSDGYYVLSGSALPEDYSFIPGSSEPWLIKLDSYGNLIWKKDYDKITHEDYLHYRAERTSDGGYIIGDTAWIEIGSYEELLLVKGNIRLTKYDKNGNPQWNNTFAQKNSSEILDPLLRTVTQASDGGYAITSAINPRETSTNSDIWLIKTDGHGKEQWNKTFGGPLDDSSFSISGTSDKGFVLAGKYTEQCSYGTDAAAFILKTDSAGNEEWIKIFSNCTLYSVRQTADNGYIAAGVKNGDAWLVKLSSDAAGSKESIEHKEKPGCGLGQTKHYTDDIFDWIFQWNHFK